MRKKNVLIVEDDKTYRDLLSEEIKDLGVKVYLASDGISALNKIKKLPKIDLILLDILMPRMDGKEFIYELHMRMKKKIPIMVLTNLDYISYPAEFPIQLEFIVKANIEMKEIKRRTKKHLGL